MVTTKVTENMLRYLPAMEKIVSFDVTSGTSVELLNVFDTDHDLYFLDIDDMATTVNADEIRLYLGNAPSTWLTGGWQWVNENYDTYNAYHALAITNPVSMSVGVTDLGAEGFAGGTWIRNPASTTRLQTLKGHSQGADGSVTSYGQQTDQILWRGAGTSYNSCKIEGDSGTFTKLSGTLYRLGK